MKPNILFIAVDDLKPIAKQVFNPANALEIQILPEK